MLIRRIHMRKYLLHVLIISFVFLLAPTAQVVSYAGAIEDAKEEVRKNPDDAMAHFKLGVAYGESGKYEEAIESLKQAIEIDPDYTLAHSGLGVAYAELGMQKEAIGSLKQAIRIDPDHALAYARSYHCYRMLKRWRMATDALEKAIEAFKRVIRKNPDDARMHYLLGLQYVDSGNRGSALEQYQILKKLDTERANKLFDYIYK